MEESNKQRVVVACRIRPMLMEERKEKRVVLSSRGGKRVTVCDPVDPLDVTRSRNFNSGTVAEWHRDFKFDTVFDDEAEMMTAEEEQEALYTSIGIPLVQRVFGGYNSTLLAYGQTGSGKTYSMTGPSTEEESISLAGLIWRVSDGIFDKVEEIRKDESNSSVRIEASYCEIYQENVRDLLMPTGKRLRVREHPERGAWLPDLTTVCLSGREELRALIAIGSEARATAATNVNTRSSRSHAIFTLRLQRQRSMHYPQTTDACIRLVDLAGSERVSQTGTDGARLTEAKSINRSLAALCDVVEALASNARNEDMRQKKNRFVPYRNSRLTWLLKDSLSGKSFITLLACVSPAASHYDETVATLKYAERARRVVVRPRPNYLVEIASIAGSDDDALTIISNTSSVPIMQSSNIIHSTPSATTASPSASISGGDTSPDRKSATMRHSKQRRSHLSTLNSSFTGKRPPLHPNTPGIPIPPSSPLTVHDIIDSPVRQLSPQHWPNLTNLNPDPEFAGTRVWPLRDGVALVGAAPEAAIRLTGGDVLLRHALLCSPARGDDIVVLVALAGAIIHINGRQLDTSDSGCGALVLSHGAHVVFARRHAFRFEAYRDDDTFAAIDPTAEWHAAQRLTDLADTAVEAIPEKAETNLFDDVTTLMAEAIPAQRLDVVAAVAVDPLENIRIQLQRLPAEARAAVLDDLSADKVAQERTVRRPRQIIIEGDTDMDPRSCADFDDEEETPDLASPLSKPPANEALSGGTTSSSEDLDEDDDDELAAARRRMEQAQSQYV